MNRYHWFVLTVAALGWLFDCLDQQLFTLARPTAMRDLLGVAEGNPLIGEWAGYTTSVFIIGWATGGLIFGALGDRIGRAKTMLLTILVYSLCTGLSSLSISVWDFMFYRFITGLGVGGEFAVGVALVAEVMPDRARPRALSLLQALSAIGNVSAALIGWGLAPLEQEGISAWRVMFIIGALPALLALVIRWKLKEPERFTESAGREELSGKRGSYAAMFGDPRWRRSALVGLFMAIPGVVGLWGIGFFSGDLTRVVFRLGVATEMYETAFAESNDEARTAALNKLFAWEKELTPQGERGELTAVEAEIEKEMNGKISAELTFWQSLTLLMQQLGAAAGMYTFGWLAQQWGRKPAFLLAYICAMATTFLVFWKLSGPQDFWMLPLMGFFQLSLFALYAIYFPEIFPTYLRSTGTSFCYNVGRYVAAFGPVIFGLLTSRVFTGENYPAPLNWPYAGMTMSCVFLIGVVTLMFARETKGQPLPE
ncbi:MAG: MFS transporter [Planctomycetaceae bacterium]|nr:MFS transporter [Planctomycetaceae bacterium]